MRERLVGMLAGTLPGLLLCVVLGGGLHAEILLPTQPVTFSGQVSAPACTARLEESHLVFTRPTSTREDKVPVQQVLRLWLSACEVDAVGLTFRAPQWPNLPTRGSLMNTRTQRRSPVWYYTVEPDLGMVQLASDSAALASDQGETGTRRYFLLSDKTYWLTVGDMSQTQLPLWVTLHRAVGVQVEDWGDLLEETFMLSLSYR